MNTRNWIIRISLLVGGVVLGAGGVWWLRSPDFMPSVPKILPQSSINTSSKRHILYWASPMNPKIHASHPMKDNMGMAYIPVYAPSSRAHRVTGLSINPRMTQNLGVRIVKVQNRQMGHAIHTVGTVVVDENQVYAVNPRFSGWVEQMYVRAVGDSVQKGQVLAEMYSPELYSAEQEYLIARRSQGMTADPALVAAAQAKLQLLGIPKDEIAALAQRGKAKQDIPLIAPASGVVEKLNIHPGSYLSPQTNPYEIANLHRVWVNVAVYAYQLPWIAIGNPVRLHLPAYPDRSWKGHLHFLYPTIDPQTRTVTARLSFTNADGKLRPGTYADATILASPRESLAVPSSAVLHTSQGTYVMLRENDGHFLPVQVALGPEADGWVAINKGLKLGDQVVENAQFLLYSESQFQSVKARMLGTNDAPMNSGQAAVTRDRSALAPESPAKTANEGMAHMSMGSSPHD
ncbi:efflux RND transporter periplasmic adaptor subunit [Acidithiobacillus montserratensis]|uniref:Efflux RND transporter periplasmic adaptor subunit n=1 Tax=Acidithiobacillus montserratensis TaxID=2729135 RepID=A0ACD5HFE4_9PROT|nr:efflux RND transporter periplasmic adaptor subunit [Acidithiobacillus montserratensis]MBU2748202.1 efflux RND transporter periplasmic adaptor subunit [Acidithiobacillus montserratensis]